MSFARFRSRTLGRLQGARIDYLKVELIEDPETLTNSESVTEYQPVARFMRSVQQDKTGALIRSENQHLQIAALELPFAPATTDRVRLDGQEKAIKDVEVIGDSAAYLIEVAR